MTTGTTFLSRTPTRCLGIALLLGLLVAPVVIPLRVVTLACAALVWTFIEAGNLRPLGIGRRPLKLTVIWGFSLAVAVIVFGWVVQPAIEHALDMRPDYSAYRALMGNVPAVLKLLGFALLSAAFAEEVLFRGFLLHQLTAIFGSGTRTRWVSIFAGGTVFGLAHYVQGPLGMLTTGIVGMVFGWAWFRTQRNLWALMLAHALIDIHGIGMLYYGRVL